MNLPELAKLRAIHNRNVELLVELRGGTDLDAIERAENAAQQSLTDYWTTRGYPGAAGIAVPTLGTTERPAIRPQVQDQGSNPAPKRRGRPPGSRNRVKNGVPAKAPKIRIMAANTGTKAPVNAVSNKGRKQADQVAQATPKKRGRPLGSKNKPKHS